MKLGSLCSGAGALDLAVETVFGARAVWHAETDHAASRALAAHWPDVPNHGDLTTMDWGAVEPVDVMCAGWPCQPFSAAGKRKGHLDERAIWPHIAEAIRLVRPRFVVLENVTTVLRVGEFQRVASSLAEIGYDLRWTCLRASDIGAPHRRDRLFIVAVTNGTAVGESARGSFAEETGAATGYGFGDYSGERAIGDGWPVADADEQGSQRTESTQRYIQLDRGTVADTSGEGCCGNTQFDGEPLTRRETSEQRRHPDRRDVKTSRPIELLPTPSAADGIGGHINRSGDRKHELLLPGVARLLGTPQARDYKGVPSDNFNRANLCRDVTDITRWGKYGTVITRWEQLTRLAPPPTELNRNGNPRLNPAFSEWMMGWPQGWVTNPAIGIGRSDQLRLIGNGVVPQQVGAALGFLDRMGD